MKKIKQNGIGLLELMFSLAVIAVLIIMASRYYQTARQGQQVNEAADMINAVYTAGNSWIQNSIELNFAPTISCEPANNMICDFVNNGTVPSDFSNATANPWGGSITATPSSGPGNLAVTLSNVPTSACANLVGKFSQKVSTVTSATCATSNDPTTTFTVVFSYSGTMQ